MAANSPTEIDAVEVYEQILEQEDQDRHFGAVFLDKSIKSIGHIVMWVNFILVIAIVSQVFMRYAFSLNFPQLDELQWHLYGLTTMFGLSYALVSNSHVRVDLLHVLLSRRSQRIIEILGILFLLTPFLYLMIDKGFDYFYESWRVNERSDSPIGLPARWALKAVIPSSFILLGLAAVARLIHDAHALYTRKDLENEGRGLLLILGSLIVFALIAYGLGFLVETTEEKLVIYMFMTFIGLLFSGYPVAWTLAGVGVLYCGLAFLFDEGMMNWTGLDETLTGLDYLTLSAVVNRIYATMSNAVLVALPMFIFMGLMLDESGVAERLMTSMQKLFGRTRGGLAITVVVIGIILAASTGIIGASVVLLGVLSLPAMMKANYSKSLSTGIIAASGTLGILIPPSIMLVIMADQMALSVGDLFMGAVFPGVIIGGLYLGYIFILGLVNRKALPIPDDAVRPDWPIIKEVIKAVVPPLLLILAVLGSVFVGLATPTEASGVGAIGATFLALAYRKLNWRK
ncbi:MAG: TRAP transporter large permease subunit, partial [OCS116 cluster bacterium]|nr:TRAP transporter large permease subunit [OCS116 cluster bacterium]